MPADPTAPSADPDGLDVQVEVDAPATSSEPAAAAEPADPVAELEAKVAKLEQEKKDNYDRFLRSAAELCSALAPTRRRRWLWIFP